MTAGLLVGCGNGNKAAETENTENAAEQGDALSLEAVSEACEFGWGMGIDYAEAAKYYRLAEEQGSAAARHRLGILYL